MLPGATYVDPELSWKYESGPAGTEFVRGTALKLTRNRKKIDVSDPRLAERVADNLTKFGPTESESLIVGTGFGTTTDIEQGPDGNLYVVSITDGAIYKISRR